MDPQISHGITVMLALIISLSIHEWSHAFSAFMLGDDTAKNEGRLTLNPIAHIDPVGTLLLPIIGLVLGFPIFGWARPVPVNLSKLPRTRWANPLVSAAGPISNLILSLSSLIIFIVINKYFSGTFQEGTFWYPLLDLLRQMILLNSLLAFFNLIPLPPLDGAAVLGFFLPKNLAHMYERYITPYGFMILFMLFYVRALDGIYSLARNYVIYVNDILLTLF